MPKWRLAAAVPAVLYYVALFIQVDLLAARNGIHGLPLEEVPQLLARAQTLGELSSVPLAVLIVWMFVLNRRPEEAGLLAALAALIIGFLTPGSENRLAGVLKILTNAGRGMLEIAAITGLAGVVIGVLQLTGLGFTLTLTLLNIGQSNALLLLVLTAIVSIILGMGMPTTAVYVLLAVLVAPGLGQARYRSDRCASVYFLLRHAEHGHAAGVHGELCGGIHRQNRSGANRLGGDAPLRHRLCRAIFVCFFTVAVVVGHWYEVRAFGDHRDHRRDPARRRHSGISFSSDRLG